MEPGSEHRIEKRGIFENSLEDAKNIRRGFYNEIREQR
ncbi:hypothetical protein BN3590_04442 [Clostridium sp. C105KSO15]|nr:hypothetical protein BN3590_04442 [Clostridium sp. C105KSO15]